MKNFQSRGSTCVTRWCLSVEFTPRDRPERPLHAGSVGPALNCPGGSLNPSKSQKAGPLRTRLGILISSVVELCLPWKYLLFLGDPRICVIPYHCLRPA